MKHYNLGLACKEFREKNNITQKEIAERCGRTYQYIAQFEKGDADTISIVIVYILLGMNINVVIEEVIKDNENIGNFELDRPFNVDDE